MNNDRHEPHSGGIPFDEAQWQAQERARLAARDGGADADAAELRIARALRHAPPVGLPDGFAARVAALAQAQAASASRLERNLLRALTIAFGLSAAATVAYYGRDWAAAFAATLPGGADALPWAAMAALCLAANWGWGLLRHPGAQRHHA